MTDGLYKYLIMEPDSSDPGAASIDDIIAGYNVDPDLCFIKPKDTPIEKMNPELIVLGRPLSGNWNLEVAPKVETIIKGLARSRAERSSKNSDLDSL